MRIIQLCALLSGLLLGSAALAQSAGDRVVGLYKAVQKGNVSHVRISKVGDGYRAQVVWLERPNNANGTPRLDIHNPDAAKRRQRADQVVLIDRVRYHDGVWEGGEIYDPTEGKSYTVQLRFKDARTLAVKGSLFIFSQTVLWTRIEE